jgi:hypothetical protein
MSLIIALELLGRSVTAYNSDLFKVRDFIAHKPESKDTHEIIDIAFSERYLRVMAHNFRLELAFVKTVYIFGMLTCPKTLPFSSA